MRCMPAEWAPVGWRQGLPDFKLRQCRQERNSETSDHLILTPGPRSISSAANPLRPSSPRSHGVARDGRIVRRRPITALGFQGSGRSPPESGTPLPSLAVERRVRASLPPRSGYRTAMVEVGCGGKKGFSAPRDSVVLVGRAVHLVRKFLALGRELAEPLRDLR